MPDIIFDNCVLSNFALSEAYPIIEALYANTAYATERKADDILKSMVYNGFYSPVVSIRELRSR